MFTYHSDSKQLAYKPYFFNSTLKDLKNSIVWEKRDVEIKDMSGRVVFSQKGVEAPAFWSQNAVTIAVSKYFRGHDNTKESSIWDLCDRVARTIASEGYDNAYFRTISEENAVHVDLMYCLINQLCAFNSPVWFNVGVKAKPQSSACFIVGVEDNMESILNWVTEEGLIFRGGSGSGVNISKLREKGAKLSVGGYSSGPLSFALTADRSAGAIKSGGTTRRAAKLLCLDVDHPDIEEFIETKVQGEKIAQALIAQGFSSAFNADGGAYELAPWQNANNSVRLTDAFMQAVEQNGTWDLVSRANGKVTKTVRAGDLFRQIALAAWKCGDPGLMFDTTINDWHTCPHIDRIYAANPCVEYHHLNNTACNLASINLMKVQDPDDLRAVTNLFAVCMEIIVEMSGYPTPQIAKGAKKSRTLGLGFANLGALLMQKGLPYDSDEGRAIAANIMSSITVDTYAASMAVAKIKGSCEAFSAPEMRRVLEKHKVAAAGKGTYSDWVSLLANFDLSPGMRNMQATVLAPTGTIGFIMDCDTTGVEPDLALVKYKKLVGGGNMKIVNQTVSSALINLGYSSEQVTDILQYIGQNDMIEGAPHLNSGDLPVFDCSLQPANGKRYIAPMGHVRMMAAVQPFISGGISKTVNMPAESTVEDVEKVYMDSWKMGIKAIAIYRDGCKQSQPLNTSAEKSPTAALETQVLQLTKALSDASMPKPKRREMPKTRASITHKFKIAGYKGYFTVGLFEDATPGELFVSMSKQGSTLGGLMDAFATAISIGLQYGVPLSTVIEKFKHTRFEPSGFTGDIDVPQASSLIDYIFQWMEQRFSANPVAVVTATLPSIDMLVPEVIESVEKPSNVYKHKGDSPPCAGCGALTVRSGSCYKCNNCGTTTGCG